MEQLNKLRVIAAAALLMVPLSARGNAFVNFQSLNLGDATNYAAFACGGMIGDDFTTSNPQTTINGNGALGPLGTAHSGSDGHFTGYFAQDPSAIGVSSTHWVIDGGVITKSLAAAVASLHSVATYAAGLTPDVSFTSITVSRTINSVAPAGVTVVNIGTISYTGTQQLTLSGGSNDFFVVNIANQIKLTHSGVAIQLAGGLKANHVLFNLTTANAGINALDISGGAEVKGTFIAENSNINLHSGIVDGAVMSCVDLTMVSGSTINGSTFVIPEPTSFALVGLSLLGLGFCSRRKR